MTPKYDHALIIGAGAGLSASLARRFAAEGLRVTLAARDPSDLGDLCDETGAAAHPCDAADFGAIRGLFAKLDDAPPDVVVYNPSMRVPGAFLELDPETVDRAVRVTAMGGFVAAQEGAKRMLPRNHGALLFTGASASVKAFARSTAFGMGKHALRALAQSLARELHPQGVHVGHFVIDGGIRSEQRGRIDPPGEPDRWLDPDAIAASYWHFLAQDRSVWSWELEVRPWVETF